LNRDIVGGSLRGIAKMLDERLHAGAERIVLDNTYVTRAARSDVMRVASARGAPVRCVFFETPLVEAQVNVVLRMLDRFGRVIQPEEMASLARTDPAALAPNALSRMTRDLEPPALDEGFSEIEVVPFVRDPDTSGRAGIAIALDAIERVPDERHWATLEGLLASAPEGAPCLLFAWRPRTRDSAAATTRTLATAEAALRNAGAPVEVALCPHEAGPPICWCRPPLPALLLAFAHRHDVNLGASTLYGQSSTDRKVARLLGMSFELVSLR
jgi:hypothetical protein